jgi:RNA recognition motif-containing protein
MSNRLYVGNLPFHATEDLIQQHFSAAGEVASVQLMIDRVSGQSRGFGFVEMASPEGMNKALADLRGGRY